MKKFPLIKALSLVLVGVLLAGGALAIRHVRGRLQASSTWRSLEHPFRDTSAEESAVYSTIIDKLHHEDRLRVFVVRDHTAPCKQADNWCGDKEIQSRLINLKPETFSDYATQNAESIALSDTFSLQRPAIMFSNQQLPEFLVRTNLHVNLTPIPSRKIYWGKFYDRYPLSPGLISLSRVGFDSQIDQALVYEEMGAGISC
ncbi:MAG: hypothetical protein AABN95_05555 [Acidobacteriota bacterium]